MHGTEKCRLNTEPVGKSDQCNVNVPIAIIADPLGAARRADKTRQVRTMGRRYKIRCRECRRRKVKVIYIANLWGAGLAY